MMPTLPLSGAADPTRRRRAVLGVIGGAIAVASFPAFAQKRSPAPHRIGFLGSASGSNRAKGPELLKEAMPRISRAAFLVNPAYPPAAALKAKEPVARALKLGLRQFEARGAGEFDSAFAAMAQRHVDAVVVQGDTLFAVNAKAIAALALRHRLPSAGIIEFAEGGGLIGNGPDRLEGHRRAATFVDKILKGANPGDLPIERATKFHLVINLGMAKALGLAIPQALLLRADEIIQ